MNIVTAGDSFTYGEELADRESTAWPYLLAKRFNASVTNLGIPAASNDTILRTTMDHFINSSDPVDLVAIGWSSPGRIEYADEVGTFSVWPGYDGALFANSRQPWRKDLCHYVSMYHNDRWYYVRYIQQILLLQAFLKHNNVKFVMMDTWQYEYYKAQVFNNRYNYDNKVDRNHFMGFGSDGMAEWTYGCPLGPRGHFLEQGHQIVSDKIYEHTRNLGWFS